MKPLNETTLAVALAAGLLLPLGAHAADDITMQVIEGDSPDAITRQIELPLQQRLRTRTMNQDEEEQLQVRTRERERLNEQELEQALRERRESMTEQRLEAQQQLREQIREQRGGVGAMTGGTGAGAQHGR